MKYSETVDTLLPAMAAAKALAPSFKKDTDGHKYKYADLDQVVESFKQYFAPQGLYFQQGTDDESGSPEVVKLITRIWHIESGQWMESSVTSNVDKFVGPQGVGSAMTYLRRYALATMMGVATDDDDGAAAGGKGQQRNQQRPQQQAQQQRPANQQHQQAPQNQQRPPQAAQQPQTQAHPQPQQQPAPPPQQVPPQAQAPLPPNIAALPPEDQAYAMAFTQACAEMKTTVKQVLRHFGVDKLSSVHPKHRDDTVAAIRTLDVDPETGDIIPTNLGG